MRKIETITTVSRCVDGTSIMQDTVKTFDQKYHVVLDNNECQAHSVTTNPAFRRTNFYFPLKNLDVTIKRLHPVIYLDICTPPSSKFQNTVTVNCYLNSLMHYPHIPTFPIVKK